MSDIEIFERDPDGALLADLLYRAADMRDLARRHPARGAVLDEIGGLIETFAYELTGRDPKRPRDTPPHHGTNVVELDAWRTRYR